MSTYPALAAPTPRRNAPAVGQGRFGLRPGAAFWSIAFAFAVAMAFAAVPTPLYVLYAQRDGFATTTITLIFAVYAVGVIASLFFAGHLSDRLGRRRLLVPALLLEVIAGLIFITWPALPGLLLGRVLTGVAVGLVSATATAHLADLQRIARPGTARTRADVVATSANLGGIGIGPLISGFLAQYVADPLRVPYMVFEALLLLAILGVAMAPETVTRAMERPAYRPQRIAVPHAARTAFFVAATAAFTSQAILGLLSSLAPSFLAGTLHQPSHMLAGLAAFLSFAAAALSQILLARLRARRQLGAGLVLASLGVLLVAGAVWLPSLLMFLAGGVLSGAGAGLLFKSSITAVGSLATTGTRGETLAGLFLIAYLGLAGPSLGMGLAAQALGNRTALFLFASVVLATLAGLGRLQVRPESTETDASREAA